MMDPLFIGAITLASLGVVLLVHHGCVHASDPADSHAKVELRGGVLLPATRHIAF